MTEKPSYLGLLNAIAVGERGGAELFEAWAEATPSDDVRGVLQTVAIREGEHARAFEKRLDELGYCVLPKEDPELCGRVEIASSTTLSDCEKFERLGFNKEPKGGPDFFAKFFEDTSMDIATTALMGRYVGEERDTGRRLRACYAELQATAADGSNGADRAVLTSLDERLCRLEAAIADLAAATSAATSAAPRSTRKR